MLIDVADDNLKNYADDGADDDADDDDEEED